MLVRIVVGLCVASLAACGGGGGGGGADAAAGRTDAVVEGGPVASVDTEGGASHTFEGASSPAEASTATPAEAPPNATAATAAADEEPTVDPNYVVVPTEILKNPTFAAADGWTLQDAALVKSEARIGNALNIGWQATQTLAPTALQAGKSYTLIVRARADKAGGTSTVTMRFRKPKYAESVRTHKLDITATGYQEYRIDFTAPNYVGMADVVLLAKGARLVIDSASLKMRAAIPVTEPIVDWTGSHVPAGYELAFNDEFNGTTLNRKKWFTRYINGNETQDHLNDEKQRYRDNDNHVVGNGVLSLVARKVSTGAPGGADYESGMVRSDWTARYGYYEARVKMPGGVGVWAAFWLISDVSSTGVLGWPPEIDIFEFVNNGVENTLDMLHSGVIKQTSSTDISLLYRDPAYSPTYSDWRAPFKFNEAWHTVGTAWEPGSVTVFVDGKKIYTRKYTWTYGDGNLAGPAHILLNLAVGGAWAGRHGIDDSKFPQAMQVDWVRAYRKLP